MNKITCFIVAVFLFCSVSSVFATVIQTFGLESAVTNIERSVEYTGLSNGIAFADYSEDGVYTTHPTDNANCQNGRCGSFNLGNGGFYYSNGFDGYVSIRTTDNLEMYAIELLIGSGFGQSRTVGHWEAFDDGLLTGSGEFDVDFGSVLGFYDEALFDELRIATYSPNSAIPTFFDSSSRQVTAMDNVYVQLSRPVPEPASLILMSLGLVSFAVACRHRKV